MIMEREKENNMTTAVTTCSACNKDNTAITDPECGEIIVVTVVRSYLKR
jgi:hypothetical protein